MTAFDEAVLKNMGDEALGIITACWYSAELDNPINKKFAAAFRAEWKYDPGFYAAATYVEGAVLEAALTSVNGKIEDKPAFMKALRATKVDTARGPVAFDEYGNIVGNVYIRKVERKEDAGQCGHPHLPRGGASSLDLRSEGVPEEPVYSAIGRGEESRPGDR